MKLLSCACRLFPFFLLSYSLNGQIVGTEKQVNGGARTTQVRGKIKPLFWKAVVDNQVVLLSLANVETFGLQEYAIDNTAYVRELTVTFKSRTFVRIYHVEPRATPSGMLNDAMASLEDHVNEAHGELMGKDGQRIAPVIKSYPTTTHKEMVEYRVRKKESVVSLYENLETAFLAHHASELVAGQRPQTIREVRIETTNNSDGKDEDE